jgi:hypothetical protein
MVDIQNSRRYSTTHQQVVQLVAQYLSVGGCPPTDKLCDKLVNGLPSTDESDNNFLDVQLARNRVARPDHDSILLYKKFVGGACLLIDMLGSDFTRTDLL